MRDVTPVVRHLVGAACAALLAGSLRAQEATTTVLMGRVVMTQTATSPGGPLPYASITLNGKSAQFTDSLGRFQVEGLASGDVTVRARHIGFSPAERTVRINRGDTVRVTLQLTRLAIQLPAVHSVAAICNNPGAPNGRSEPELLQLYQQLRENADHFKLLTQTNPYVYAAERQFVTTYKDSVIERTPLETLAGTSVRFWKYEAGKMIVEDPTTSITNMHLPGLVEFADDNFAKAHCFDYGGIVELDSASLIRVDFVADHRIKAPDVDGSIFLDPKTYQIRRAQITLTRVPYDLSGQITGHTVTTYFSEVVPGIPIIAAFEGAVMKLREGEVRTELQRVVEVHFINGKPQE